ncbi:MAG: sugar ABC transporter permease, partial [Halobacteriales archaeon SW_8_66_22]
MSSREIYTDRRTAGLLLLPTIVVSLVFLYYPAARAARRALYSSQLGLDDEFVGLENFTELLTSGGYRSRLLLTVGFAAVVVAGVMAVALLLTFLVHEVGTGKSIYLVAAIWPYALPPAVAALVFIFLVHPTLGVLSGPFATLGVDLDWFADGRQAFVVVTVAAIWKQIGYNVIFMIASMNNIPETLTETARLDGVGRLRRLLWVYVPIMTPTLFFLVILNTIYAFFGTFAFIDIMTGGGPSGATNILIFALYQEAFDFFNWGLA